jgi:UDP-N-acetylglucosamine acyltransferase
VVGLRRLNLPKENMAAIRSAFRLIWLSGTPRKEALEKAATEFAHIPQVMEIVDFVRASQRGVMAADRNAEA